MNKAKLSIGIPTYNRINHLKRLMNFFITELENIPLGEVEIIFSDNASSDGTDSFLANYYNRYTWLKININKNNVGASRNFEYLRHNLRGEYIWIPGDDDYLKKGIVKKILDILTKYNLSYINISSRRITENSKSIDSRGKLLPIIYEKAYFVSRHELVDLLVENVSNLAFMTASVIKKDILDKCEDEIKVYSDATQSSCCFLFDSVRAIQSGMSYFISDIFILNGDEITWRDSYCKIEAYCLPEFADGLKNFNFTHEECKKIKSRMIARVIWMYIKNRKQFKMWENDGFPGISIRSCFEFIYLIIRKVYRKIGLSKRYIGSNILPEDFGVVVREKDPL